MGGMSGWHDPYDDRFRLSQPPQTFYVVPSQFPSHDAQAQQALAAAINRLCDLLERGADK